MSMSKINVQYSNKAILESIFNCKVCGSPIIMFGCSNVGCSNYYKKNLNKERGC